MCAAARENRLNVLAMMHAEEHMGEVPMRYDAVMWSAARGGHEALVRSYHKKLQEKGDMYPSAIFHTMCAAARGGHEPIVRLCCEEWGDGGVNYAMADAARGGHEELVRKIHDTWNITDVDWAMRSAAKGGYDRLVCICKDEWGATDVVGALNAATLGGQDHVVRLCLEKWGADTATINDAMFLAAVHNQPSILKYLFDVWNGRVEGGRAIEAVIKMHGPSEPVVQLLLTWKSNGHWRPESVCE